MANSSLSFNGTNSFVTIPHSSFVNPTTNLTLAAWILPLNNNSRVIEKDNTNKRVYVLKITSANLLEFDFFSSTTIKQLVAGTITQGVWQHICCVYNGSSSTNYINGSPVGSAALSGAIDFFDQNVFIGSHITAGDFYRGNIKDPYISGEALTADQVMKLYKNGRVGSPGALLPFNDGRGNIAKDYSGHGCHGAVSVATWSSNVPIASRVPSDPDYFVYDVFSGSNDTAISDHTPNVGGSWTQTAATSFYLQGGKLQANRKTDGDLAIVESNQSDLTISANLTSVSDGTNVGLPGLVFRYVDSSNFWYCATDTKTGLIAVYSVSTGVTTEQIHQVQTVTNNLAYKITIKCFENNITLFVNDVEIVTVVSSVHQSATKIGVRYGRTASGNTAIYGNLEVVPFTGLVLDWPVFTEYGSNPIVALGTSGTWDDEDINNPNVVWDPNNNCWQLYYSGYDNDGTNIQHFGLASATNLLGPWTKNPSNPVVESIAEDGIYAWNGGFVYFNNLWYVYYGSDNATTIRCMTSPDLVNWTRQGIVINHVSTWEGNGVFDAFARIRADGTTIELWYGGGTTRALGYATSTDGLTFTKYSYNPPIPLPTWSNTANLGEPSAYVPEGKEGEQMLLSFDTAITSGKRYISQAITLDGGVTWHYRVGALKKNTGWNANQVFDSFLMLYQGIYYMFFAGSDVDGGSLSLNIQIGVATATPRSTSTLVIHGN